MEIENSKMIQEFASSPQNHVWGNKLENSID